MTTERDEWFETGLRDIRQQNAVTVPHLVDGEWVTAGTLLERDDPSHPGQVVSRCHDAPSEIVDRAVQAARRASRTWGDTHPKERAQILLTALDRLTDAKRAEMAVFIGLETGKIRSDCYSEPDELAILLERYAATGSDPDAWEEPLDQINPAAISRSVLRPYGVFGVISPFNFPMVLGAGPALAALVAGNTVVWKPSHLAPRSAHAFAEIMNDIDLPRGVFNVVHGADDPGRRLVDIVDGVTFTGSAAAGLSIRDRIAAGRFPRPLIAELGGKNPVIVTDTADLALAAEGIAVSAFGVSGQKCSCASRVLVTPGAHDELVARVGDLAATLNIADPIDRDSFAGPLITAEAMERFHRSVEVAAADGEVVAGGRPTAAGGQFAEATLVAGLPFGHRLTREEVFLPFITVTRVPDFAAAIEEANNTEYGLTAGIYTGNKSEALDFLSNMQAGCINVNKPGHATTGWWPANQNFGGWKASGLGSKLAFGKWYVQQFAREQSRTVAVEWAD